MIEHILHNLPVKTSPVQERSEGAAFLRVARETYPVHAIIYVALNIPIGHAPKHFLHCTYGDSWAKQCTSQSAVPITPASLDAMFNSSIRWSHADAETSRHDEEKPDTHGFGIQVACTRGETAALIILSDASVLDSRQQNIIARDFRVLANYFHQHMLRIFGHDVSNEILITARELDCLKWIAAGKTAWEVSVILGITERTVRFHLNAAREKLYCATTTQAVAKAISQQLITI
jgi:DNA-binding CsgD family transcriptional regulator